MKRDYQQLKDNAGKALRCGVGLFSLVLFSLIITF